MFSTTETRLFLALLQMFHALWEFPRWLVGPGDFPSPVLALRILPCKPHRWSEPKCRRYLCIYMLISTWISPEFCLCPAFSSLMPRDADASSSPSSPADSPLSLCCFLQALAGVRAALTLLPSISRDHRLLFLMASIAADPPLVQHPVVLIILYMTFPNPSSLKRPKSDPYQVSFSGFKWKCSKTPGIYFERHGETLLEKNINKRGCHGQELFFFPFQEQLVFQTLLVSFCGLKCQLGQE